VTGQRKLKLFLRNIELLSTGCEDKLEVSFEMLARKLDFIARFKVLIYLRS